MITCTPLSTVWLTPVIVPAAKPVPGVYATVIGWAPTVSALVAKVATPFASVTGEPRSVVPSLNCTVPVAPETLAVAVNVTDWPNFEGEPDVVTVTFAG